MKLNLSHLALDTSTGMQLKQQSHRVTLRTNRHFQQSSELSPYYVRHVLRPQSCSAERSVLWGLESVTSRGGQLLGPPCLEGSLT